MTNNNATHSEAIATGEIDERALDHVSGGIKATPLMIESKETPYAIGKISLKESLLAMA